jgi:hypothetical protein
LVWNFIFPKFSKNGLDHGSLVLIVFGLRVILGEKWSTRTYQKRFLADSILLHTAGTDPFLCF